MSRMKIPDIQPGKHVVIDGRMPNWLTVSIGESYAHRTKSVSFNQPNVGITTAISHSRELALGSFSKDLHELDATVSRNIAKTRVSEL